MVADVHIAVNTNMVDINRVRELLSTGVVLNRPNDAFAVFSSSVGGLSQSLLPRARYRATPLTATLDAQNGDHPGHVD